MIGWETLDSISMDLSFEDAMYVGSRIGYEAYDGTVSEVIAGDRDDRAAIARAKDSRRQAEGTHRRRSEAAKRVHALRHAPHSTITGWRCLSCSEVVPLGQAVHLCPHPMPRGLVGVTA